MSEPKKQTPVLVRCGANSCRQVIAEIYLWAVRPMTPVSFVRSDGQIVTQCPACRRQNMLSPSSLIEKYRAQQDTEATQEAAPPTETPADTSDEPQAAENENGGIAVDLLANERDWTPSA